MSYRKTDPATSGTMRLLEAIIDHQKPLRLTDGDEQAQREVTIQHERSMYPWGERCSDMRKHWTQQARFRYNGRENAKRKGTIRNNVEARMIERLGRKR